MTSTFQFTLTKLFNRTKSKSVVAPCFSKPNPLLSSFSSSLSVSSYSSLSSLTPLPSTENKAPAIPISSSSSTSSSISPIPRYPFHKALRDHVESHLKSMEHLNDDRLYLFSKKHPDRVLRPGSFVLITSITSMSKPKPITFAGVVLAIDFKGIDTSITVLNTILKTVVQQTFKVYSPMVQSIEVLKRADIPKQSKLYHYRDRPKLVDWNALQNLVKAHTAATSSTSTSESTFSSSSKTTSKKS